MFKNKTSWTLPAAMLITASTSGVALGQAAIDADPVPVNIMFVVDSTSTMAECFSADRYDSDGDGVIDGCSSTSKFEAVKSILAEASASVGEAYIGLAQSDPTTFRSGIGTRPSPFSPYPSGRDGVIVPLRSSISAFNAGVESLTMSSEDAISHAEILRDMLYYYSYGFFHCDDTTLCSSSPIQYYCQKNYVVVITDGTSPSSGPTVDALPLFQSYPAIPNVKLTENEYMDNIASLLANVDASSGLVGQQVITTYVMGLDINDADDVALFESVADNASSLFTISDSYDSFRGDFFAMLSEILEGSYQEAPPVLSTTGDKLLMGWYDVRPYRPLYYGQFIGADIETDPDDPNFGEIIGVPWDAGEILESRQVLSSEVREIANGNNGELTRDIYTNINEDEVPDAFDASNLTTLCPLLLDLDTPSSSGAPYPGALEGHDLNFDSVVDELDCQELIDFVRGYSLSDFRSTGQSRGNWKLGSIRHSQPAVAEPDPVIFSRNPYLRDFLNNRLADDLVRCPSPPKSCEARVAFVTASDGMLHAFNVDSGDELWAYIPRNVLGQTVTEPTEKAELLDLMWSERVMLDGTPTVAFVWIDGYEGEGTMGTPDGQQSAEEWLRVLLVGQGEGGRYYLALDITQPDEPYILWEDTAIDPMVGLGATTSSAAVGLVLDGSTDKWVAFYGSGLETWTGEQGGPGAGPDVTPAPRVNRSSTAASTTYDLEARLYIRAMEDFQGTSAYTYDSAGVSVSVDLDGDGSHDKVGFPSNPTIVDRDNDGDTDEVFLVSSSGAIYKFVIDTTDIDNTEGCLFFDPQSADLDDGQVNQYVGKRTSGYWSATAASTTSGEVLMYWGTGSPYDLFTTDRGYFYVVHDYPGCVEGELFTECDDDGTVALDVGEKLMGSPVVYNKVVYFTTYAPSADRCTDGQARLYGIDYEDCTAKFETNGTSTVGDGDDLYQEVGSGMPSGVVIANDSIYVATTGDVTGASDGIIRVDTATEPMATTVAIQWRELF